MPINFLLLCLKIAGWVLNSAAQSDYLIQAVDTNSYT